jgi:ubiquinone/menaquinone biosynthesis C-methylase UbiE
LSFRAKGDAGTIADVDPSTEMVARDAVRNAEAIARGQAELRRGSVERLPFDDNTFNKALAINLMRVWPAPDAGLVEIRRVMKPGGTFTPGFTVY